MQRRLRSGQHGDPVRAPAARCRGSPRGRRRKASRSIDPAGDVGALGERGEAVAARRPGSCSPSPGRSPPGRPGPRSSAHVRDLRPDRRGLRSRCSAGSSEICRIDAACARRLPLLLQHGLELRAGQRDRLHDVAERLHGERLAVGDHAVALAGANRRSGRRGCRRGSSCATCAPPLAGSRRAGRRRSRRPAATRPAGPAARVRSAVIVPTCRLAIGRGLRPWPRSTIACDRRVRCDVAGDDLVVGAVRSRTTSRRCSIFRSTTESSRPNDRPWMTGRGLPAGS